MKHICIIGGGAVSAVLIEQAIKDRAIKKIVCGTNNTARTKAVIPAHHKVRLKQMDAANHKDVARIARGAYVVVNASLPRFNIACMKGALAAGAQYMDLASELANLKTPEQYSLEKEFIRAGRLALINAGAAPGVTNIMVKDMTGRFEKLNAVHIRLLEHQIAERFEFSWSVPTTLDDIASPPLVVKKGQPQFTKPLGDEEWFEYPAPFGKQRSYSLYGDEVSTLPRYVQKCDIDCKSGGSDIEHAVFLLRIGLLSKKPVIVNRHCSISPYELLQHMKYEVPTPAMMKEYIKKGIVKDGFFIAVIQAEGIINKRRAYIQKTVLFPSLSKAMQVSKHTSSAIAYAAGTAAYAFMKVLGQSRQTGVIPPEALDVWERKAVVAILKKKGMEFK